MILATATGALALFVFIVLALWWARKPVGEWGGR